MGEGSITCPMAKNRTPEVSSSPAVEPAKPSLSLEKAEKGSPRSMWELLLQLRVLLPYLSHLVPLLDRNLAKGSPNSSDLTRGITGIENSTRDLETLTRNQTIQLERIEQQLARLRVQHEDSVAENYRFFADMRSFRRWMIVMTIVTVVILGASAGMLVFIVIHG
jgi:hypothetical protein